MKFISDMSKYKTGYKGFVARITINGELHQKSFRKKDDAVKWLRKLIKDNKPLLRKGCPSTMRKDNTSGRTGIRKSCTYSYKNGKRYEYPVWEVFWYQYETCKHRKYKMHRTSYSIKKHGDEGARVLAIKKREEMERKYYRSIDENSQIN